MNARTVPYLLKPLQILVAALLIAASLIGCDKTQSGEGPHMRVRLITDQVSSAPGSQITLGVHFIPDPGWHIYWKNAGDSGLPPQFTWRATEGVKIGAPLWPYPEKFINGPLANYGYGDVLLPFPTTVSSDSVTSRDLTIDLKTEWLVCKDECLPGQATLHLLIPVSAEPGAPSSEAKLFEETSRRIPIPLEQVSIAVEEQEKRVVIALIPLLNRLLPSDVTFFPEDRRMIANADPQEVSKDGDALRISLAKDPTRRSEISRIRGVLVSPHGWSENGEPKAVAIDSDPSAESPSIETASTTAIPQTVPTTATQSIWMALVFAFVGGLILNLMPCVFPVLSIKILSFVEQAGLDRRKVKLHGILFCAGVVVSFWLLAGLLFTLRAGGEQLGWGFQLQSPVFVVAMILVFIALGILFLTNLQLGRNIQTIAGTSRIPVSLLGSFLNGVLATAVATPCTAPFMSSALAATLTLPTALGFTIFTAIGLGMSAPYLVLSYNTKLLSLLPRPGEWMESFKQLMAFPLFATVIWLMRVFARQMGMESSTLSPIIDLLWGSLLLALGLWLLSRSQISKRSISTQLSRILALLAIVAGVVIAIPKTAEIELASQRALAPSERMTPERDHFGLLWEPFSQSRLEQLLENGESVYVDFTAEWCITCQVNERIVFSSDEVRALLNQKKVVLMRADWTSKNPAITAALGTFGRNGVPLNVLYPYGQSESPVILPNILTPGIVLEELRKL